MQSQENNHEKINHQNAFDDSKKTHLSSSYVKADHHNFDYWLKKNSYYHQQIINFYRFIIPENSSVLQINCRNGYLLDAVKPFLGVGIDTDQVSIAQAQERYSSYRFYACTAQELCVSAEFDYIILSLSTMQTEDIQDLFLSLKKFCHAGTRIIIDSYAPLWEPVLKATQKLGLRRPTEFKNWLSKNDIQNFLHLSDFEVISSGSYMLMPTRIPLLSWAANNIGANIPLMDRLCLQQWIIAKPLQRSMITERKAENVSVSIIIPCRNEKGNVEPAVLRCPEMGSGIEIIFVEGNSKDGTVAEIKRVIEAYPEKNIKLLIQDGKGKGDAVRKGFAHAQGDILMIQDADLTAPPEELPKFFNALVEGKGEFINGSRLIYGMEAEAMRFLNLLANHFFSVLFSWLLGQKVKDTLCGTKVLWKKDYEKIAANRSFFGDFDPFGDFDLLFGSAKLYLKIIDMPVHYKARTYGSTQIRRFLHGWILLGMSMLALKKFKLRY